MKDNSIYNEQIDRFLKGKMSTEEEQQFKTEIGQNPELKQQPWNQASQEPRGTEDYPERAT